MKLASARAIPLRLGLTRPLVTALGEFTTRESVVLELCDGEGACGHGEAAPWRGFGGETLAEAQSALERAVAMLGESSVEPAEWPLDLVMALAQTPSAHAAVEGALCDLAARRAGQPLAAFLRRAAGLPDAPCARRGRRQRAADGTRTGSTARRGRAGPRRGLPGGQAEGRYRSPGRGHRAGARGA